MIQNLLKISLRVLYKYKTYSLINLAGLSIGILSCLLIVLYVQDELSFDRHHANRDQIYRVTLEKFEEDGQTSRGWAAISPGFGPKLESQFSAIEKSVRFWFWGDPIIASQDQKFVEDRFVFAEQSVFDIFTVPFVHGQAAGALTEPNSVVLTQSVAGKYFGNDNPVGRTLQYSDYDTALVLKVTGVVEDVPRNSHFRFDFLASFVTWETIYGREFMTFMAGSYNFPTYLRLAPGTDPLVLLSQFPDFLDRNLQDLDRPPRDVFKIHLQSLNDVYLNSDLNSSYGVQGDSKQVKIFALIAFLILLVACINFIILTTARASRRAKEISMRKILGADRTRVIAQYLGEAFLQTGLALLLALVLAEILLTPFNAFTGKALTLGASLDLIVILPAILLFVGLVSGGYPAIILARFRTVQALKGGVGKQARKSRFQRGLVIIQFAISIGLIICVGVVRDQLSFLHSKDHGFNKDHIATLPATDQMIQRLDMIKQVLRQNPGILGVSASSRVPSGYLNDALDARVFRDDHLQPVGFRMPFVRVDADFLTTYDIQLAAGRNFSPAFPSDSTQAFILNETAVTQLGWSSAQEAIGQAFAYGQNEGRIVGVVEDFHFEALQLRIKPMVLYLSPYMRSISVRLAANAIPQTLDFLRQKWTEYRPDHPFTYSFVDDGFARRYSDQKKLGEIFSLFSGLAILIACLGLFGLAAMSIDQRTREIGIRKVMGASVPGLLAMLSREFTLWVALANLIAWPLAGYAMNRWLEGFAYRIEIVWSTFVLAGGLGLIIALATISTLALRAALANPVTALRYE